MNGEQFDALVTELRCASFGTLCKKATSYGDASDLLHNFRAGAEITGLTPAQTAWGYMTKHLVALRDKVERDDFADRDDLLEKCQDIINYVCFIWCIGNEGEDGQSKAE